MKNLVLLAGLAIFFVTSSIIAQSYIQMESVRSDIYNEYTQEWKGFSDLKDIDRTFVISQDDKKLIIMDASNTIVYDIVAREDSEKGKYIYRIEDEEFDNCHIVIKFLQESHLGTFSFVNFLEDRKEVIQFVFKKKNFRSMRQDILRINSTEKL